MTIPVASSSSLDIGHSVVVELWRLDGRLQGVAYTHPAGGKPGAPSCAGWVSVRPEDPDGWEVVSEEPLTLSPSLLCRACGHHGFIRVGRWISA